LNVFPQSQSSQSFLPVALLVSIDSLRALAFSTPHWGDASFAHPQTHPSFQAQMDYRLFANVS